MQYKIQKENIDVLKDDITKMTKPFNRNIHFDKYHIKLHKLMTDKILKK